MGVSSFEIDHKQKVLHLKVSVQTIAVGGGGDKDNMPIQEKKTDISLMLVVSKPSDWMSLSTICLITRWGMHMAKITERVKIAKTLGIPEGVFKSSSKGLAYDMCPIRKGNTCKNFMQKLHQVHMAEEKGRGIFNRHNQCECVEHARSSCNKPILYYTPVGLALGGFLHVVTPPPGSGKVQGIGYVTMDGA